MHVLSPDQLNTYDVLVNDEVVFTTEALRAFLAGPASTRSAIAPERSAELAASRALAAESAQRGDAQPGNAQPGNAQPGNAQPGEEEGQ